MPRIFDFFLSEAGGPKAAVHIEFPDDAWAQLMEFVRLSTILLESKVIREGLKHNVTLRWHHKTGMICEGEMLADDDLGLLLHRLRPFILQKESTYLPKMLKLLARYIENDGIRTHIREWLDEFTGKGFQEQLTIAGSQVLNSDAMVNNWLNGFEFHHADDAQAAFEEFRNVFPEAWQRGIIISMLVDKVRSVLNTLSYIQCLDRKVEFTLSANN